jgi:four helix bundle protein
LDRELVSSFQRHRLRANGVAVHHEAIHHHRMQDPNKLRVTKEARSLAVNVYRLTSSFPPEERFGICAQMRRAAVGIGSNIAEGCGRRGDGELLHFLYSASGSASELAFQLSVCVDLAYGDLRKLAAAVRQADVIGRMLNRLTAELAVRQERRHRNVRKRPRPPGE